MQVSQQTAPIAPAQLGHDRFNCPMLTGKWKWSRAKGGQTRQSQPSPRAAARSLGASVLFRKYKQHGSDLCAKHYLGVVS